MFEGDHVGVHGGVTVWFYVYGSSTPGKINVLHRTTIFLMTFHISCDFFKIFVHNLKN